MPSVGLLYLVFIFAFNMQEPRIWELPLVIFLFIFYAGIINILLYLRRNKQIVQNGRENA